MSTTKTYSGKIRFGDDGEACCILFLSSLEYPLADVLQNDISRHMVTARYWITDQEMEKDDAREQFLKQVMGFADCDYGHQYSEITGYLWTDEKINIGGHDLIAELGSFEGKWLILEVEIHDV